jgi:hypothetical protein
LGKFLVFNLDLFESAFKLPLNLNSGRSLMINIHVPQVRV